MTTYTETDLLRLAKRFHNTKRTYLLVDPLQAKHLSVQPSKALEMFHALGKKVGEACDGVGLVIGFAETATAVGMAVAEEMSDDCIYIHTTRELVPEENDWVEFCEEHSHAVEQKLSGSHLDQWIKSCKSIVFVDDEISTGKTLINIVSRLKEQYPEIEEKRLVAASIINRVSEVNEQKMRDYGLECVSLLKLEETDYAEAVKDFSITEACEPQENDTAGSASETGISEIRSQVSLMDPRLGVSTREYRRNIDAFADSLIHSGLVKKADGNILVVGTEECMYPAIVLGSRLEQAFHAKVFTHSTTRSPIGICADEAYPIRSGYKLKSLYDAGRTTYIYNLEKYDQVILVTDSEQIPGESLDTVVRALRASGNDEIFLIRG
uniref:Orotate phosphoribosyltransferase n=1 Tax=Eubacterium cellulosolvens (strain ATCC 43171 / JCM 9499 / 6) TaxID=633697 RepID=I5AXH1_EUBC6